MAVGAPVTLRPFRDEDYPRYVEVANLVYPEYRWTEAEARHDDATWEHDRYDRLRLVAEDAAGRAVAFAQINHMPNQFHPRKYAMDIGVDPAHQHRGVGGAAYERLLAELRDRAAIVVRCSVKETMTAGVAFLGRRGFAEVQRTWESRLDVAAFDFGQFAGAEERAARQGIAITTLAAERARDPEALRRAYDLHEACMRDVPAVDPITDTSYGAFVARMVETPASLPEGYFLAVAGGAYVGESNLFASLDDPGVLYQGLTGLRREYRGRGVALALKLRTIRYAREHGRREIRTWNDVRNQPMLRINEALGFARQPAWLTMEKALA